MKCRIVLCMCLIWLCRANIKAQSCCATASGCNSTILPDLDKHLAGLRWTYSQYDNRNFSLDPEKNGIKNNEMVNTLELFGRFNLPKRFQLSVFVPVTFIHQYSSLSDTHDRGLGDASLLAQYQILNPVKFAAGKVKHQLRVGLGVKLPTGRYKTDKNDLYNTSVQLGSGSVDVLMNATYSLTYKKMIMNARLAYKLNTVNSSSFRFGDKIENGVRFSYVVRAGKITLMPTAGANYAYTFDNHNHHQPVYESHSHLVTASAGLEAYVRHFAFSVMVLPVLYHEVYVLAYKQRFTTEVGAFYTF
ncbi:MAG: hypothetical protein JWO03_516 [Bacteroidetes bacterium]|nr:hypothetical protein [Bacteroidota bacterium]